MNYRAPSPEREIPLTIVGRSDSDGLHVAREFYELGHEDTRPAVRPHAIGISLVADGDSAVLRDWLEELAAGLLELPHVSEIVWTVTAR